MGLQLEITVLFLNLVHLVQMTQRLGRLAGNVTSNSTTSHSNSDGHSVTSKITIAVALGVGLTALIISCIGIFLCRGYFEQKRFTNHRQLLKMERLNKNVTSSESKLENEQSKDFTEEVL
ncbi:uncharacterized protein LOC114530627 [Dendronephthya gigantea]|uniref:uncharacterized protein LOC114530627 n=1 Tax=Dendronephthya gigantea TaxID=151771 RepID=UPI0010695009|nr:uncharacterized protein LOC114530627 [Dendronephthya gigantea]